MLPEWVMQLDTAGKQNKRLFGSVVHSFDRNKTDDNTVSVWNYNVCASYWLFLSVFFMATCCRLTFWPAIFFSKDLTKWPLWNLFSHCLESQSAAEVALERLFVALK